MAYAVISLYDLLRNPNDAGLASQDDPWAYAHRWTLGRSLWEAGSPSEFRRAWRDSTHSIITNFTLANFVENGEGEEVDEFAEIILNV